MKNIVILLHEIYGISESLVGLKNMLESQGYTVLLPSLYDNDFQCDDETTAYQKFYAEVGLEKGKDIVNELIAQNTNANISLIGFSVGATIAWMLSEDVRLQRVIGVYGSQIRNYVQIEPRVKTTLFFTNEQSFDVAYVIQQLSGKSHLSVIQLNTEHGFYHHRQNNQAQAKQLDENILQLLKE